MYRTYYLQLLFAVVCAISAGCIPRSTDVDSSQSANLDAKGVHDHHSNQEQEQNCKMTIHEKQKLLMLAKDYQDALDLMPQLEKELLGSEFEKRMLMQDPINGNLYTIRQIYTYLYVALGRDEEALQKILEIDLPVDANPLAALMEVYTKTTVLARLNLVDEVIDEYHTFLNGQDTGPALKADFHALYAEVLCELICAQVVKGDFESVQSNIDELRYFVRDWWKHREFYEFRLLHSKYNEFITYVGYYINNLSETHIACFIHEELKPPMRSPEEPDKVEFGLPRTGLDFVSKTDGSSFTLDDLRKALAESMPDPFPVLQNNVPVSQELDNATD